MQSPVGQVGGYLGQRRGVAVGQRPGVRQRQPSQHAVHVDRQSSGSVHGVHISESRRVLQRAQRDRRLPAAFCGLHRLTGGFDGARVVAAGGLRPRLRQGQLRSEQRRFEAVPRLRPAENLCGLELVALLAERLGQQDQRQRTPGVPGACQRVGGPPEQRYGGVEIALGDRHVAHQRLADRPAGLLQFGEVGVALGQRASIGQPPCHHQRGDPAEAAGEPQQTGMVGGGRAAGQRLDVVELSGAGRAQRRRRGRPSHRHLVGVRRRQHLAGDP